MAIEFWELFSSSTSKDGVFGILLPLQKAAHLLWVLSVSLVWTSQMWLRFVPQMAQMWAPELSCKCLVLEEAPLTLLSLSQLTEMGENLASRLSPSCSILHTGVWNFISSSCLKIAFRYWHSYVLISNWTLRSFLLMLNFSKAKSLRFSLSLFLLTCWKTMSLQHKLVQWDYSTSQHQIL